MSLLWSALLCSALIARDIAILRDTRDIVRCRDVRDIAHLRDVRDTRDMRRVSGRIGPYSLPAFTFGGGWIRFVFPVFPVVDFVNSVAVGHEVKRDKLRHQILHLVGLHMQAVRQIVQAGQRPFAMVMLLGGDQGTRSRIGTGSGASPPTFLDFKRHVHRGTYCTVVTRIMESEWRVASIAGVGEWRLAVNMRQRGRAASTRRHLHYASHPLPATIGSERRLAAVDFGEEVRQLLLVERELVVDPLPLAAEVGVRPQSADAALDCSA